MIGLSQVKHFSIRNPFVLGVFAGIFVVILNISIAAVSEGSIQKGMSIYFDNGIFAYLIPLTVAIQIGLFRHYKNMVAKKMFMGLGEIGVHGSLLSSLSLVVCCVCCIYPISAIIPTIGILAALAPSLIRYKDLIIAFALLVNVLGSIFIARAILRIKKENSS